MGDSREPRKLKVMLSTEGTYPFHQGGVSTWSEILVNNLSGIEYVIYSIIMNPYVTQKIAIPGNAKLIRVPLWGTDEPSEHLEVPFSKIYIGKKQTTDAVVVREFLPIFKDIVEEIISMNKNPIRFGNALLAGYQYFQAYDYQQSFKSEMVWETYKTIILKAVGAENKLIQPSVFDLIQSLGWVYRFFVTLNTPVPNVDVVHSAAAAFCGIPAVLAKLENKTPFLLTEHGVYLREQYLALSRTNYSPFLNTFLIRLIHAVSGLNYALADQVSPVCEYNIRWETVFGVTPAKIDVIYNGVNRETFTSSIEGKRVGHPTVVTVARVDPVKDLVTLIRIAARVKETIPDVKFFIYGTVTVPEYYEECLAVREQLQMSETVIFAGHTQNVPAAYRSADVVALTSITEAFPYSVVEAMMTGKAIVATDVGGVSEAIGKAGIVVRPRQIEQFSEAVITLLKNPDLRKSMGEAARIRALDYFSIERTLDLYFKSYIRLAAKFDEGKIIPFKLKRQKLHAEKGYALAELGFWEEAIEQFRLAIEAAYDSAAVPILLTEIAGAYSHLGKFDLAQSELEKAEAFAVLTKIIDIA